MSFFKRFIPLNADMNISLENQTVEQGQPFKGSASLVSRDKFRVEEVRIEILVKESWEERVLQTDSRGNQRQVMEKNENILYSQDVPISQQFDMGNGDKKDFPFEVTIPMYQPTRYGGFVAYSLKAVASVKGRMDVTRDVNPTIVPSTGVTKIIEKQVIKVPCKYCGTLIELTSGDNKCPTCGNYIRLG